MSSQVVLPGRDLIEVARGLEAIGRSLGKFAYQWSQPGPNSKPVIETASVEIPVDAVPADLDVVSFTVPDGMVFSLTGFVTGFSGSGWTPFSTQLVFSLFVQGSGGSWTVDYLRGISWANGSLEQGPYPVPARLEFKPRDVLTWRASIDGTLLPGVGQNAFAQIYGHLYPIVELR
jgi:hypothetical protein